YLVDHPVVWTSDERCELGVGAIPSGHTCEHSDVTLAIGQEIGHIVIREDEISGRRTTTWIDHPELRHCPRVHALRCGVHSSKIENLGVAVQPYLHGAGSSVDRREKFQVVPRSS